MTDTKDNRCENCRFAHINWREGDEFQQDYGSFQPAVIQRRPATSVQCRRHAPMKAAQENDSDGWPWIAGNDWCGEFQPTPETPHG